jgi:hypothetical protein
VKWLRKSKSNSENIWKIQKKIVKRYEIYGRKVGLIVKWYGKYGRKVSWNVKQYGKYGWNVKLYGKYWKQFWKDMENMEER